MTRPFWNGFEKRASTLEALKGAGRVAKTFSKGALVGAGLVGAGVGLHHAAGIPSVRPLPQQGY
jgi:hypothetical protein